MGMEDIPSLLRDEQGVKVDREDEQKLIRMIKAGDYRQFDRLIIEYQKPLYVFIWRMVKDEDDAKDICQETFFKAYKKIKSYKVESKFSSWLFKIGYRKALDQITKNKKKHIVLSKMQTKSDMSKTEKELEVKETHSLIGQIIDSLHHKYRTALHLFYREEMTYSEIAAVMKIPMNTVKSHLFRGKEIIREKLARLDKLNNQPT